jgi:hypothetical protein
LYLNTIFISARIRKFSRLKTFAITYLRPTLEPVTTYVLRLASWGVGAKEKQSKKGTLLCWEVKGGGKLRKKEFHACKEGWEEVF